MVTVTINIILITWSFPHDNFSSVYWIFNKLGHMIPMWKGKNPIYVGVKAIPVNLWELLGGDLPATNSSKGEILCVVVAYM